MTTSTAQKTITITRPDANAPVLIVKDANTIAVRAGTVITDGQAHYRFDEEKVITLHNLAPGHDLRTWSA